MPYGRAERGVAGGAGPADATGAGDRYVLQDIFTINDVDQDIQVCSQSAL